MDIIRYRENRYDKVPTGINNAPAEKVPEGMQVYGTDKLYINAANSMHIGIFTTDGKQLKTLKVTEGNNYFAIIIDIMMPGMNGLEMCRKIRETNNIPIIMLSAKSTDLDKILGLGTGADDYVTKPFNPLELTARVKSQLRRYTQLNPNSGARETVNNEITIKGMSINRDNHKVIVDGEEIKLTPIEFDILYLLASNPGKVFSTDEIFEKVWNEKVYEANNTVMVHIRRLRGKMKEDTRQNKIITTVWGVGYKIEK